MLSLRQNITLFVFVFLLMILIIITGPKGTSGLDLGGFTLATLCGTLVTVVRNLVLIEESKRKTPWSITNIHRT